MAIRDKMLADEAATAHLAACVARLARQGDVLTLWGDLGMGKTSFARAFIATRAERPDIEVPSPTFTLLQTYDLASGQVWHYDLYRLATPDEVWELGWEEGLVDAISLVEWPQRLGDLLPAARLDVTLTQGAAPGARMARLASHGAAWDDRLVGADV